MRGDVLGFERRRRWSDEDKLGIVTSVGVGGATVAQVAQRHDVTRQQVYAWRHELRMKGLWSPDGGAHFLPVDVSGLDDGGLVRGSCMGLLLSGGDVTGTASTQTVSLQKVIELQKRRDGRMRRADLHADARRRIKHPGSDNREDTWQHLDVEELPGSAIVDPLDPDAASEKCVPAVVDHDMLPDMGRMNGRLQ